MLNKEEQTTVMEIARIALGLRMTFDIIGDELDMTDDELETLKSKLQEECYGEDEIPTGN